MKRLVIALAVTGVLVAPAAATAHISLHPNEIPAGAFVTVNVRVPGEQPGAYAYKVVMELPAGFTDVDVANIPGWSAKETITTLKKPLQTPAGPVNQVVSQISWTGDRSTLGRLDNGYFVQFPIDMTIPSNLAGRSLTFKTVEFYSNGQNAFWIGPPSAAYPAPTINITRAGGVIEDVAGNEAGPIPGFVPTGQGTVQAAAAGSDSDTLAIVAVALAALALAVAGASVARRRRAG
ncbi:MAG TPA: YcnI family protein [Solirubrobacteraceae bacterium]|nr:YcnI family protein [Solirubrobacteraceae bacterium]